MSGEGWAASWEEHERAQLLHWARSTATEKLLALDAMVEFALRHGGALRRPPAGADAAPSGRAPVPACRDRDG